MDQAITRAAGAAPRAVGEFQGYVDGADGVKPSVRWLDRKNMPQVGDTLFALPRQAAVPRSWSILLTSANHGTVGPLGSTFPHAGEKHERVHVMEIVEAGAPPAPGVDLAGLVRFDFSDLDSENEQFGEVAGGAYFLAHEVEARCAGATPVAAQAGQVAVPEGDYTAHHFRKKPVVIEAVQFVQPEMADVPEWLTEAVRQNDFLIADGVAYITTLEGIMAAQPGDWIIRGVKGEIYPCKPEIFAATYELAAAPAAPAQAKPLQARYISINENVEFQARLLDAMVAAKNESVTIHSERIKALTDFIDAQLVAQASTAGGRQEGDQS